MSSFNTSNSHPLIPNSNQYYIDKKYVSIHSEDRDILRYPKSSEFEIELPQDYLNVHSAKLYSWTFPANYSVFSSDNSNNFLIFKFIKLYNPGEFSFSDPLSEAIFAALYNNLSSTYVFTIEPGFYNPQQMAIELTNQLNRVVTAYLYTVITDPTLQSQLKSQGGYTDFVVAYSEVGQKLWFGNRSSSFTFLNEKQLDLKNANS
jgi:hypothetical protein